MSDPYHPPTASAEPDLPRTGVPVPDSVVSHFALVRPWARGCAIAGYLAGFVLLGLVLLYFGFANLTPGTLPPALAFLTGFSLLLAGAVFASSTRLWAFCSSIDQLCLSMDGSDLEVTVHLLHRFWRLAGIGAIFLLLWLGDLLAMAMFSS